VSTINQNETARFLSALDSEAAFFTFQTFDDNEERKDKKLARVFHGPFAEHAATLKLLNSQGAGVFVAVNVTDGKGRKKENIARVRAIFVDLDGAPLDPVVKYRLKPHIITETSPSRWHAYWRVDGLPLEEFTTVQKAFATHFNGDPSVCDLARVMRLPGFEHRKRAEPFHSTIKTITAQNAYSAIDFRTGLLGTQTKTNKPDAHNGQCGLHAMEEMKRECASVAAARQGTRNTALNRSAFVLGQLIAAGALDQSSVCDRLTEAARAAGLGVDEIEATIANGLTAGLNEPRHTGLILDPTDPMRSARKLVATAFSSADGARTLHRHRGAFWSWTGSYYRLDDDETIRAQIWAFLESALVAHPKTEISRPPAFRPNRARVSDTLDALGAVSHLDTNINPPAWLSEAQLPPPGDFFACANGLLHLPTGQLFQSTPNYFGLCASEVLFDPNAPEPREWKTFCAELFGDEHGYDQEASDALQEWFGYSLSSDTSLQKILLVVGPKRGGKGTIARVMSGLLGRDSVAGPTMSSLADQFGLEPLISKPLAIISDARIGARTDKSAIVERLLSVSGEDQMTVARKFRSAWHGRLATRFVILTNELPSFHDGSGALAGRFIILQLNKSFFGREDPALTKKLSAELPGILNWALEGYRRLRERGSFAQPRSAQDAADGIEMLSSPVKAFIRDRCTIGAGLTVTVEELWSAWQCWSQSEGHRNPGTKQWFGRNLRAAESGVQASKRGSGDDRELTYVGIRLRPQPM
jgi:putative DNA primase/helicase